MTEMSKPVLFNLCDGTHWCGWENPVVRMSNTVRTSADEKKTVVLFWTYFKQPLFI